MGRTYLDACVIIYLMEGEQEFRSRALSRVSQLNDSGSEIFVTSVLSRLECRVVPLRQGNVELLANYDAWTSFLWLLQIQWRSLPPIYVLVTVSKLRIRFIWHLPLQTAQIAFSQGTGHC